MILKEYLKEYNIIGVEVADLYQEGLIGLMHAIHSYNSTRDVLFIHMQMLVLELV